MPASSNTLMASATVERAQWAAPAIVYRTGSKARSWRCGGREERLKHRLCGVTAP